MTETFSQLLEESFQKIKTAPGSILKGIIISIGKDSVIVDAGLKSESSIPIEQFKNKKGELDISIGDLTEVSLDTIEDGFGETILSREKAKRHESWLLLEQSFKEKKTINGTIDGKVKGGFTVSLDEIRAFLPGSLVDVRPVRDTMHLEGKNLDFKVIKLDKKRNNVVVSRRAVIEYENSAERNQLLEKLQEGLKIKGIVKNLTEYGAFVDLGGVDGLLHITDMAWKRVKHPNEIVSIGDEISVKILKFDREKTRVSLGLKQLGEDPWIAISNRYPEKTILKGRVTNLTDYGCFVEIEEGIEGLVHVSEMDWTNKNIHPSKVVNVNDIVEIMVLDIDEERRRISLGIKQCKKNPWKNFSEIHKKGTQVIGKIKSITDFGIFIGLPGGIDGLVHLSDIDWNSSGEETIKKYKKGEEITAIVLQVDPERERISLGIKQLQEDPLNFYLKLKKKNSTFTTEIKKIEETRIITKMKNNIHGIVKLPESSEKNNNINVKYKINDIISTKINNVDKKHRTVYLTIIPNKTKLEKEKNDTTHSSTAKKEKFSNAMMEAFKAAKNNE
ncbi:30S ribosomal protein S1 [Buchnera aphidicola]|uniref:30S ribosomal protein S1 n=1 Tax=Buchnera aphidicola (Anoecia oenotherae) TaxID=1241833 RepID=A0A4D6XVA0_9GAMM|nr:30S ribosomal protein S1 [Buchnera aphidicola]QCI19367.1 30S ribosomal protein S1 [Buchnera aphidicola (Anoecia oenotherae)]